MRKALMIASMTLFAVAAFAAPKSRQVGLEAPAAPAEEVASNPSDEQGVISNVTKPVDEKV